MALNLEDKIWKTSKSRMNMADRLKSYDNWSQFLIIYYSLWLIGVTIYDINTEEIDATISTLILSIVVLVMSVYIYAKDFGKRALETQRIYIEMQRKLGKFSKLKDTAKLEEEYYNILDCSENHQSCDFLKLLYSVRNNLDNKKLNGEFTYEKHFKYLLCFIKQWLLIFMLFLIPIISTSFFHESIFNISR